MAADKKGIALIVSKMRGEKPEEPEGEEADAGLEAAASELMQALEDKDAAGVVAALKSFVEMC